MGQDLSLLAEALGSPWHTHRPSQLVVILTEEEAEAWPHPGLVGLSPWDANRGHYDPHLGRAVAGTSTESLTLATLVAASTLQLLEGRVPGSDCQSTPYRPRLPL